MTSETSLLKLPEAWRRKHLAPAEQRVVELIGAGQPNKLAAAHLNRSPLTVRNQLNSAMRKLRICSRYELIAALRPLPPAAKAVPEADFYANAI